jgi:hypothetical protein
MEKEFPMSVPLTDLHLKFVVDFTIRTVQANADQYIKEIFGDAKLDAHAALYGDQYIEDIKSWVRSTKIPVVLGFDLDPAQIPGVTIHLDRTGANQAFMGDAALAFTEALQSYEREVLVPRFSPKDVEPAADGSYIKITLPDDMAKAELVIPGLRIRDKNGREYGIGEDRGQPTAVDVGAAPLSAADLSEIEIISPYQDAQYREQAMVYDDSLIVACHGHANRSEGLWLWAIVQWGLLKYRPLLTAAFGMDLATPSASDFSKDSSFLGDNVWTRYINLTAKSVWSWKGPKSQDVVAFLLSLKGASQDPNNGSTVELT